VDGRGRCNFHRRADFCRESLSAYRAQAAPTRNWAQGESPIREHVTRARARYGNAIRSRRPRRAPERLLRGSSRHHDSIPSFFAATCVARGGKGSTAIGIAGSRFPENQESGIRIFSSSTVSGPEMLVLCGFAFRNPEMWTSLVS